MPPVLPAGRCAEIAKIAAELAAPDDPAGDLVAHYLGTLLDLVAARRPASQVEIDIFRGLGDQAAGHAVPSVHVIRLLSASTCALWPRLPEFLLTSGGYPQSRADVIGVGTLVWETAHAAISAVIAGHEEAQRHAVLRGHGLDQRFLADLLSGTADVAHLLELAEQVGFHFAVPHFATVVAAEGGFTDTGRLLRSLEAAVRVRAGRADALVGEYRGDMVIVMSAAPDSQQQIGRALAGLWETADAPLGSRWRAGMGRAWQGLRGVGLSYHDAREALNLSHQLGSDERIVPPGRLLLYRVLLRDRRAMADLVRCVLGPLCDAHNGPEPFLDTLDEYFTAGGVLTETARALHLSVRAVSYRFDRIRALTGNDINVPMERLMLQMAVMGARLLDWPAQQLADLD